MPIFSLLGADCTVLDYSDEQLQRERDVAAREGYSIEIVKGDMTNPLPFPDNSFDLIFILFPTAMWKMYFPSGKNATAY